MKDTIRATLSLLSKQPTLDLLQEYGIKRKDMKKAISQLRLQVTEEFKTLKGQDMAPVTEIHGQLANLRVPHLLGELGRADIGIATKEAQADRLFTTLERLAFHWKHQPAVLRKPPLTARALDKWHDEFGYNIFDTPYRNRSSFARVREQLFSDFKRERGKTLYKAMCIPSEPVEFAPTAYGGDDDSN